LKGVDTRQAVFIRDKYILHDNVTILHHPQTYFVLDLGCLVPRCPFLDNKPYNFSTQIVSESKICKFVQFKRGSLWDEETLLPICQHLVKLYTLGDGGANDMHAITLTH
jgi:hypothetical protein